MFATYVSSGEGAITALVYQLFLLVPLALALGAFAMRGNYFPRIARYLLGGCLSTDLVWFLFNLFGPDSLAYTVYRFIELWDFAIYSAIGLVGGLIVLEARGHEIKDSPESDLHEGH
jgi:hypothetical protein